MSKINIIGDEIHFENEMVAKIVISDSTTFHQRVVSYLEEGLYDEYCRKGYDEGYASGVSDSEEG